MHIQQDRSDLQRLFRAALLTAIVDGAFATYLSVVLLSSNFTRLWQGVAGVLIGPVAFDGGVWTVLLGLLIHGGVSLGWSGVFLFLLRSSVRLRRLVQTRDGRLKVAAVFGPAIWLVMSLVLIPALTLASPTLDQTWWIILAGHFPFVGLPIVMTIGGPRPYDPRTAHGRSGEL